jgi:hypothetical protein
MLEISCIFQALTMADEFLVPPAVSTISTTKEKQPVQPTIYVVVFSQFTAEEFCTLFDSVRT